VPVERAEAAPAKVNLSLRVLRRRADGYHDLESLVVFAAVGDALAFTPGSGIQFAVRGPTAAASGDVADNLVLKAAHAAAERIAGLKLGRFVLSKRLPVAAGLGGGSADAAAALRLIAKANHLSLDDARLKEAARVSGADVPVCLDPQPRVMRGIGEILSKPLDLPPLHAVLVNPCVSVATKDVFAAVAAVAARGGEAIDETSLPRGRSDLIAFVARHGNDLEAPAISLQPLIGDVLAALRARSGCALARMSGSGATCFGLFGTGRAASMAAKELRHRHGDWWVRATTLGGQQTWSGRS
jgi:4-diphosphocytidyl-2-C-methyl-D-erythritol kinase